jgi:glycosyltransferase involved in cell wall biosynthesis
MSDANRLSILYVSYPLLPVTPESAGGAEQMLLVLEREIAGTGHRTTVAACAGSHTCGTLLPTGATAKELDQYERREREHAAEILRYLQDHPGKFDLIHDKSGSFFRHASECPLPVLATLHLPRSFYHQEWFQGAPPNLFLNCVSQAQAASFADLANVMAVVENGIDVDMFPFSERKGDYLFWLGRICEEKAPHLAIAAARKARLPLVIAGQVYPFRYHQGYFDCEIRPHLHDGSPVRYINTPSREEKLGLLSNARMLLLTSTVEETSSLVAMEAMACGTPVVAFRRGAFPEVVASGETGILVDTLDEMATAVENLQQISAAACRARVDRQFTAKRMAREYEKLYRQVLSRASKQVAA